AKARRRRPAPGRRDPRISAFRSRQGLHHPGPCQRPVELSQSAEMKRPRETGAFFCAVSATGSSEKLPALLFQREMQLDDNLVRLSSLNRQQLPLDIGRKVSSLLAALRQPVPIEKLVSGFEIVRLAGISQHRTAPPSMTSAR